MRRSLAFGLMAGGIMLTGCMNSKVGWIEEGDVPKGKIGGCYSIAKGTEGIDINQMKISYGLKTGDTDTSEVPAKDSPLPVLITAKSQGDTDVTGVFGMVNNFFSVCTLGIWPYVKTERCVCELEVKTPKGKVSHSYVLEMRNWSSFILPIAALPCPGIGDWRSSPYMGLSSTEETAEFKRSMAMNISSDILTEDFYNQEMTKYVDFFQKRYDRKQEKIRKFNEKKKKVARKLQDIIDGE